MRSSSPGPTRRLVASGTSPQSVRRDSPAAFQLSKIFTQDSQEWILVGDILPPEPAPRRYKTRGWIGTSILSLVILGIIAGSYYWG